MATRSTFACRALAAVAALAVGGAALAQDVGLAQFGVDRWDAGDGLGSNWVRAVAEDPDGTIWIGTAVGLSRFDGHGFSPVLDGGLADLPQRAVNALAHAEGGGLWVGLEYGGVRRTGDGRATLPTLPEDAVVHDLLVVPGDGLWIASSAGVWRHAGGATARIAPEGVVGAVEVRTLAAGPDGAVWARSTARGLWRIEQGRAQVVEDAPGCLGFAIALGPDGERFMSCRDGVWRWPAGGDAWQRLADDYGVGPLHLDRRGDLWFGAESGLTRWSRGRLERLPPARGLGDWRVRALAEDRRGDLWLGSFSGGLARLHRGPVRTFGAPEGLDIEGTTTVVPARDGRLWVGVFRGGLVRFDPASGAVARWTAADGLPGETVWTLTEDPHAPGHLWIGGDLGLARFDGRGIQRIPIDYAAPSPVRVLHVDPNPGGTVWLAGDAPGAIAITDGTSVRHGEAQGLRCGRIRFFHRDRAGRLLAGGEQGLFALQGDRWHAIEANGVPLAALTAVTEAADGVLWLASSRTGVVALGNGSASAWGLGAGLPFWPVHSLALDAQGGLWLSGNDGLARLRLEDLARWRTGELAQVAVERLGRRDGLRDVETNGWGYPAHAMLDGGRLAYPTAHGVALLDPVELPSVGVSPREIAVRGAWAGTRALPLAGPLRLGRDERTLRIAFSAIELLRPEAVSFRYRLDDVDADWVDAGDAREAAWSPLPPGTHRFHLQARLPGQPWIDAESALAVEVTPQAWESTPLRLAALALALLLVASLVRWRLRIGDRHAALLARAHAFLREVIDTSPNPIFVRGSDGAYILANRAAAAIYHRTPGTLEGRRPQDLGVAPPGMAEVDAMDAEVVAAGAERVLPEHEIVDGDGHRRWFRVVKRPGFAPDGRGVEQVIGTAVDVTDFKRSEQRIRREQARLRRSREEARALSRQLLRAQEDERRRLAREIHDDLTQQLAGLSMLAWSTAQAAAREPGADRREALEHLAHGLERLANDVQALSHELHPPALEALGLAEALRGECATFGQRTGLPIEFAADPALAAPPSDVALALYRIAQEALRNSLVHARAGRVMVALRGEEAGLRLEVADDGAGFDPSAQSAARQGIGLSGMRERARLAGAELEIDSAPGRGTRIVVVWRDRRPPRRAPGPAA
jgi:PAS domain S-box-containing protein